MPCLHGPTCWWWWRSLAARSRRPWTWCHSSPTWSWRSTTSSSEWWSLWTRGWSPSTPGERSRGCIYETPSWLTNWTPSTWPTTCEHPSPTDAETWARLREQTTREKDFGDVYSSSPEVKTSDTLIGNAKRRGNARNDSSTVTTTCFPLRNCSVFTSTCSIAAVQVHWDFYCGAWHFLCSWKVDARVDWEKSHHPFFSAPTSPSSIKLMFLGYFNYSQKEKNGILPSFFYPFAFLLNHACSCVRFFSFFLNPSNLEGALELLPLHFTSSHLDFLSPASPTPHACCCQKEQIHISIKSATSKHSPQRAVLTQLPTRCTVASTFHHTRCLLADLVSTMTKQKNILKKCLNYLLVWEKKDFMNPSSKDETDSSSSVWVGVGGVDSSYDCDSTNLFLKSANFQNNFRNYSLCLGVHASWECRWRLHAGSKQNENKLREPRILTAVISLPMLNVQALSQFLCLSCKSIHSLPALNKSCS